MSKITTDEVKSLNGSVDALRSMASMLEAVALSASGDDGVSEVTLADLVPTGNLASCAQRIRDREVLTVHQLDSLSKLARYEIEECSRLNGVLESVISVARTIKSVVLPLIA